MVLEELYNNLESRDIALGLCEVKGHFKEVLMNTQFPRRAGFIIYPSVAAAVRELAKLHPAKERIAGVSESKSANP